MGRQGEGPGKDASHPGSRIVIVSNRGPIEHYFDESGQIQRRAADGGVATALASVADTVDSSWVAAAASEADSSVVSNGNGVRLRKGSRLRLIAPPRQSYDLFYSTFCNPVLWYLQHSMWGEMERSHLGLKAAHAWQLGYLPVNQAFAEAVIEELKGRADRVMFHDYHLYLAPLFVRNFHATARLQHFIHIPWPGPEVWDELPPKIPEAICKGLLGNDSVVFQTAQSARNFLLTCSEHLMGVRIDFEAGQVIYKDRMTRVWENPISIDAVELESLLATPEARAAEARLLPLMANKKTIVRVDRLDPAKNIIAGFEAFAALLEEQPALRGQASFMAFLVPSRSSVPEYESYARRVFALVSSINERYGQPDWLPVRLFYEQNRTQAVVGMKLSDVLLVNSLADGMNLVSKEGVLVNQRDSVLVLSREAGSCEELGPDALVIDPRDVAGTATALYRALIMPGNERRRRAVSMRSSVLRHQLGDWLNLQMEDLAEGGAIEPIVMPITPKANTSLEAAYPF
jgi:trehalose 6-phosphate synthase